ncbi:MAG: hypothetical protein KC619_24335 [Myxococcales bacterium]|nr:hypothetical protein [Myxococcales bacterium]
MESQSGRVVRFAVALAAVSAFGCAAGDECRFGAECPSGVCLPEGVCAEAPTDAGDAMTDAGEVPMTDAGAPTDGALPMDDAATPDLDGGATDAGTVDAGPPACHDGDDRLTADELPLPLDVPLRQRVATDVSVDTHGTERADATRLWDFEGPYAGDVDQTAMRVSPAGAWYADDFPTATYVLPLSTQDELLGVFHLDADGLTLLGVVSTTAGITQTELTYDPPAPVWRFPLAPGASWDVTSTVSGLASGVTSVYTERWRVDVDASGQAGTPDGVRDVLRVNTRITRTVGVVPTEYRRHSYVEPCVGTVAQVFANGSAAEPTTATEIWRVAP